MCVKALMINLLSLRNRRTVGLALSFGILLAAPSSRAQTDIVLYVSDTSGHPLRNVVLLLDGKMQMPPSDTGGRTRAPIQAGASQPIAIDVVKPTNLLIVDPWEKTIYKPAATNVSDNYVQIVLAVRTPEVLRDRKVIASITKRILAADAYLGATEVERGSSPALAKLARELGVTPKQLDEAIRDGISRADADTVSKSVALMYAGKPAQAESLLEKALANGSESDLHGYLFFLGIAQERLGRYGDALESFRKAVGARADLATLINYALSLQHAGLYEEAERELNRVMQTITDLGGTPDQPGVIAAIDAAGGIYLDTGRPAEAARAFDQVILYTKSVYGESSVQIANAYFNRGLAAFALDDYATARDRYKRALDLRRALLPPNHHDIAESLIAVANLQIEEKNFAEAEKNARTAIEIYGDRPTPDKAFAIAVLGSIFEYEGKAADAERQYHLALDMRRAVLPPQHPDIVASLLGLGTFLFNMKRYADAEPVLLEAVGIADAALPVQHPLRVQAKKSLIHLYRQWSKSLPPDDPAAALARTKLQRLSPTGD
jgi:tetratricopeptide (TPR) repeat protein